MSRPRTPREHEIAAAAQDPRLLRASTADNHSDWRSDALCREVDPEIFFPLSTGASEDYAVDWCRGCDVQAECLATALNAGDTEGVWGATTPKDRRAMLVTWRKRSAVPR